MRGALGGIQFDFDTKQFVSGTAQSKESLSFVEHMAQFGFSILHELAHWARERRMPMIIDA